MPEVARGGAAGDREDAALGDPGLERAHGLLVGDLLALEVALHQLVGHLGHLVHQLLAVLLGARAQVLGDLDLLRGAGAGAVVAVGLHVHEVDHALELVLGADRDLGGHHVLAERLLERLEAAEEVRALAVEHVHEDEAGEAELVGALPEPVGGHLDAHHAVDHEHGALAHAQRGQRVGEEARLAGGVDEVDLAVVPAERREARRDRHLARLLVRRGVRDRRSVSHRAQPVDARPPRTREPRSRTSSRCPGGRPRPRCGSSSAIRAPSGSFPRGSEELSRKPRSPSPAR